MQCVATAEDAWWSTPKPVSPAGGETTLKVCGVGVVMLPGQVLSASLVDRLHGERGNHPRSPLRTGQARVGQVRRRLWVAVWGGGLVVVEPGKARAHGEGGQQVSREDAGMPGGYRR